jgi:16S rRNA (cytosine967-C5)-methyltransferase
MTPAARVAAAITILDAILDGHSAEGALTHWSRNSRFAGSKDRAAVRDHVYCALRRKASSLGVTRGTTGRDWMRGFLFNAGEDLSSIFGVGGHSPDALSDDETTFYPDLDPATAHDIPNWLWDRWVEDLGEDASATAKNLFDAAPIFLRVNLLKSTRDAAIAALAADGIDVVAHAHVDTALRVQARGGKLAHSAAYSDGLVELQDASSQASVMVLPREDGGPVLDYCAGGGGKSLALAAWLSTEVDAFDVDSARMRDIPDRAQRAGAAVNVLHDENEIKHSYKTIFIDAPCSGSGTWRRDPQGKWALTADRLSELVRIQGDILNDICTRVAKGGSLIYATCSVLACENRDQVEQFCRLNPNWQVIQMIQSVPNDDGDGFFVARLTQKNS